MILILRVFFMEPILICINLFFGTNQFATKTNLILITYRNLLIIDHIHKTLFFILQFWKLTLFSPVIVHDRKYIFVLVRLLSCQRGQEISLWRSNRTSHIISTLHFYDIFEEEFLWSKLFQFSCVFRVLWILVCIHVWVGPVKNR